MHVAGDVEIFQPEGNLFVVANHLPQYLWVRDELNIFNIFLRQEDILVREKLQAVSVPLEKLAVVKFGIKLYETGKGHPPQKPSDAKNRIFEADRKAGPDYREYLEGKDVDRFKICWRQRWLRYGENLWRLGTHHFLQEKGCYFADCRRASHGAYTHCKFVTSQLLQIVKPFDGAQAKAALY